MHYFSAASEPYRHLLVERDDLRFLQGGIGSHDEPLGRILDIDDGSGGNPQSRRNSARAVLTSAA
jgi:hypothetical protein